MGIVYYSIHNRSRYRSSYNLDYQFDLKLRRDREDVASEIIESMEESGDGFVSDTIDIYLYPNNSTRSDSYHVQVTKESALMHSGIEKQFFVSSDCGRICNSVLAAISRYEGNNK